MKRRALLVILAAISAASPAWAEQADLRGVPVGQSCQSVLLPYKVRVETPTYAHGCKISESVFRIWCVNGWVFDAPQGVNFPGGLNGVCEAHKSGSGSPPVESTSNAPSFDCSKANSASARLICADKELSALDGQLAVPFRNKLSQLAGAERDAFINEQRRWINERNAKCGLGAGNKAPVEQLLSAKPCMKIAITARVKELVALSAEAPKTPQQQTSVRVTTIDCNNSSFGGALFVLVDPSSAPIELFLDEQRLVRTLDDLRGQSLRQCSRTKESSGTTVMVGIRESAAWRNFFEATQWRSKPWEYENRIAKEYLARIENERQARIQQEQLAEQQRNAATEQARVAQNKQMLRANLMSKLGASQWLSGNQLTANPFMYKNAVVLLSVRFENMISESEALFTDVGSAVVITAIPTARFRGPEWVIVAAKVTGNKAVKNMFGGETMVPALEYVASHSCENNACQGLF